MNQSFRTIFSLNFSTEVKIVNDSDLLYELCQYDDLFVIIDKNVKNIYSSFLSPIINDRIYEFVATETNKNLEELGSILELMRKRNVGRHSTVLGIGGGITTDIAAFAASIYQRGCKLTLIPTTYLAMIDAAIGGKTAVNCAGLKNNVGSFYPAGTVLILTDFLKTLPESEFENGRIEAFKMGLISGTNFLNDLKTEMNLDKILLELIHHKMSICSNDLSDKQERMFLNLGHTFAHVIESISDFEIPHGKAVGIGLRAMALYSKGNGFMTDETYSVIQKLFSEWNIPKSFPYILSEKIKKYAVDILNGDKKINQRLRLVLMQDVGIIKIFETDNYSSVINVLLEFAEKSNHK
ncbi:MAG: 3-dehydroquinate synthase [Candidatus Cloacimonetes bacterium]|nr:3-dehydroquinate synthase [Candidatus Cloacimonadota bacterium]